MGEILQKSVSTCRNSEIKMCTFIGTQCVQALHTEQSVIQALTISTVMLNWSPVTVANTEDFILDLQP